MPNFKSVVLFLLVDFGEGCCYLLLVWGKAKSTHSPTDLDCTVRLDWSLAKMKKKQKKKKQRMQKKIKNQKSKTKKNHKQK